MINNFNRSLSSKWLVCISRW